MKASIRLALGLCLPALIACLPPTAAPKPVPFYPWHVMVEDSQWEPHVNFQGPGRHVGDPVRDYVLAEFMARSWVDRDSLSAKHQIYVVLTYGNEWRYYEHATNAQAERLSTTVIERQVVRCSAHYNSCTYEEVLGVNLSADELDALIESGEPFRFALHSSRTASQRYIVEVPHEMMSIQAEVVKDWIERNRSRLTNR